MPRSSGTGPRPADRSGSGPYRGLPTASRSGGWRNRLEAATQDGGTVVLTQVLAGIGGVGKTQLAAAYARRAWAEGVGVLVWVNAATRDGAVSAYADAALALGLPLADRDDPEKSARAFLARAETTAHR